MVLRSLLICYWGSCVILYAFYTATLTSYLTLSTKGPPFTDIYGAIRHPDWDVGVMKGTPILEQIKVSYHVNLHKNFIIIAQLKSVCTL